MQFAAWEARMAKPADDGRPTRAHLIAAARNPKSSAVALLTPPVIPLGAEYLWDWYQDLRVGLGEGPMGGAAPLSWPALEAWAHQTGAILQPYEHDALFRLDTVSRHPEMLDGAA